MEGIVRAISENPFVAVAAGLAALLFVYFFFKSLIKLVLIVIIVALAVGGYYYFKHPESRPASVGEAVDRAVIGAGNAMDQGKEVYEKGRELVDRGKAILDTGIGKGKEKVEKEPDAAGKVLGKKEKEGGKRL